MLRNYKKSDKFVNNDYLKNIFIICSNKNEDYGNKTMSFLNTLESIAKGATTGVIVVTALPVFGAAGVITATGVAVGSTVGALAAYIDKMNEENLQK